MFLRKKCLNLHGFFIGCRQDACAFPMIGMHEMFNNSHFHIFCCMSDDLNRSRLIVD